MNPKISIDVDSKNKAIASLTGMVTVGAKIDVVVTGLNANDIPNWTDDDKFTGSSLRFRVVDADGKDLARFPLNEKTGTSTGDVWSVASNVFTATGVEFDTDGLRHAFDGVPFNEKLEFGVILDSVVDDAQYATGKMNVKQWSVASTEDPTVLPDWRETLAELNANLVAVETAQTEAVTAAETAKESATSAFASASNASASALSAMSSANAAVVTIKHYPQVGANGNWWVWDSESGEFVDSGKSACGYASWFYDSDDGKYHKVVISKNSIGEYCVAVDQDGVDSPDEIYVKLEGNQTIVGTKTFSTSPVVPTPSANTEAANKAYVDAGDAAEATARDNAIAAATAGKADGNGTAVLTTGNQTIVGMKTFSASGSANAEICIKHPNMVLGDIPTSYMSQMIRMVDKNDNLVACIENNKNGTNWRKFLLALVPNAGGNTIYLGLQTDPDGISNSKVVTNTTRAVGSAFAAAGMPSASSGISENVDSTNHFVASYTGLVVAWFTAGNYDCYCYLGYGNLALKVPIPAGKDMCITLPVIGGRTYVINHTQDSTLNSVKTYKADACI